MESSTASVALRWLYVALSGLLARAVLSRVRQNWRLRHFKGPGAWSWWWHTKAVISGAAHEHYGAVTEKYGGCKICSVTPAQLLTRDKARLLA